MIPTDILTLLDSKQIWELSDNDLERVKMAAIKLARKADKEQQIRHQLEESKRSDYYTDTPLFTEVYGG